MPTKFNALLREAGLNPSDVRLVRHADPKRSSKGRSPYELWRNNRPLFDEYQNGHQLGDRAKLKARYWAVFLATPNKETMFVGLYRVEYLGVSQHPTPRPQISDEARAPAGERDLYDLTLLDELSDLIGALIIDWGPGFKAWIQRAENQDKEVIRLPSNREPRKIAQRTLIDDLREIEAETRDTTTRETLVNARLGQGRFRIQVLEFWGNCCAVSRSAIQDAVRASHIKPWRDSTNNERLDPNNGLPLVASLDALFDAGLISFASSGEMIVSSKLNNKERQIFGIGDGSLAKKPTAKTAVYLAYHREKCFQK